MKTKLITLITLLAFLTISYQVKAESDEREVEAFTEISLRIPAKLHLDQGKKQYVEVVAKSSVLEEIITEVKGRELIIRFATKNYFWKDFNPGQIDIFITIPEIDGLALSGSGDIVSEGDIESRILNLAVSGSGDIYLPDLKAERVKAAISGSGDIEISGNGTADDLSVNISGSGDFKGIDFEARDVSVRIAGSGNANVHTTENLSVKVAGSGDVKYKGNPRIDQSVVGSGKVREY
ncbi:head GIN domain-containing protein [Sunxiuqinia sp. A32]|uniref:head GIN domain-containing protein n=1 Tax=Sunxiuqinia sp. A32 TaxID=3461496 RepID=UPI0040463ADF